MKQSLKLAFLGLGLLLGTAFFLFRFESTPSSAQNKEDAKIPEVIILSQKAALGAVRFTHVKHNGGEYNIDESGPIACISCHHTSQPASEVLKHPPLRTAWPADRETTLTKELFLKDPEKAGAISCKECHARAGEKPTLLDAVPQIKHESSPAMITLTNQQAYHRACASCHAEVRKIRPQSIAPTAMQCNACHQRGN
jgi:hypothetical protein